MKEITRYVADDGTIFEDEDECYEYELKLKIANLKDRVRLFDDTMTELPLTADSLEYYYYIAIYDIAAIEEIQSICEDDLGIYHPWHRTTGDCKKELGLYKYNVSDETWYNLNTVKKEIEKILEKIFF
jgi:hypothetical protein